MIVEETRKNAKEIFDRWFPIFSRPEESEFRDRLFEYFHAGYMAGTRHGDLTSKKERVCRHSLAIDDANRNNDL